MRGNVPIEVVCMTRDGCWAAAADGARNIYVIDDEGVVRGQMKASQTVRHLMASDEGPVFAALAGDGFLYAFDGWAQLEWRTEFEAYVAGCDLSPSGLVVAAVTADGRLCSYSAETREKTGVELGWTPESMAIVSEDPVTIVLADAGGHIALMDLQSQLRWEKKLEMPVGPLACDAGGDTIAVPAFEEGVLLLRRNGEELGTLSTTSPAERVAVSPGGRACLVQTRGADLLLLGTDGAVQWQKGLKRAPADWALGAGGDVVAVAKGGRQLAAYRAGAEPGEAEAAFTAIEDALEKEPATSSRLLWRRSVGGDTEATRVSDIRLIGEGDYVVFVCADGTVAALDREGNRVLETNASTPAWFALQWAGTGMVVWNKRALLRLEPGEGRVRRVALRDAPTCVACSGDLSLLCIGMDSGEVRVFRDDEGGWARRLDSPVTDVYVNPAGDTVMSADTSGRFSFFEVDGGLRHKFRFGGEELYWACGLGADFAVFRDEVGHLMVLDFDGADVWQGRPLGVLSRVEVLSESVAVYREEGACALVDPREDQVSEMWPPPGQSLLRRRPAGEPVVVVAEGNAVTAYTGFRRRLDVVWRVECDAEVTDFRADPQAHAVAALAGGELYRINAAE
ncbi:MAG: PQQ-binding-like beta-propeller repeat protein [Candidatus Brocadiia bacterium]